MLKYCEGQPQARLGLFRSYIRLPGVIHRSRHRMARFMEQPAQVQSTDSGFGKTSFRSIPVLKVAAVL